MLITISKNTYHIFICLMIALFGLNESFCQTNNEFQNEQNPENNFHKEIHGYITSSGKPLENVNISAKDTERGAKTNSKGFYTIRASKGEILVFSHIGMQPVEVIIEDITKVLNIKMRAIHDALDEVIVKADRKNETSTSELGKRRNITTGRTNIDTRKAGYSVSQLSGDDLNPAAITIGQALRGQFSGFTLKTDQFGVEYAYLRQTGSINRSIPALWDIDGVLYETAPPLDLSNIEYVAVIRSLAGTVAYGSAGAGGVIVVKTKTASFDKKAKEARTNLYTNKKMYQDDALVYKNLSKYNPLYLRELDMINDSQEAYEKYQQLISKYGSLPSFYLDASAYFQNKFQSSVKSLAILSEMRAAFVNDPEALKALAYAYQEGGFSDKAVLIYKDVIGLRPNYAQSFRDLANAYVDQQEYKSAWRVYMNYLHRGNRLDDSGAIGEIMYREMETLYIHKKESANIRESFVLKRDGNGGSNDVRMVFEWNSSEAEFELEFVNPAKQAYSLEHSFFADKELITNEKVKGYSSKDFVIEDLTKGDWLVNLRYFGNKTQKPTYFKMTVYYNWGRANQSKDITVFKLTDSNLKFQLLKLNKSQFTNQ